MWANAARSGEATSSAHRPRRFYSHRLAEAAEELGPFAKENKARSARRVTIHPADVTDEAAVKAAIAAAAAQHGGRVDAVIASAGISQPRRFEETPSQEFLDVYKLNVIGARNTVYGALPFMAGRNPNVSVQKDGGRIMLISSQAGQVGLYGYTAYSVSYVSFPFPCSLSFVFWLGFTRVRPPS